MVEPFYTEKVGDVDVSFYIDKKDAVLMKWAKRQFTMMGDLEDTLTLYDFFLDDHIPRCHPPVDWLWEHYDMFTAARKAKREAAIKGREGLAFRLIDRITFVEATLEELRWDLGISKEDEYKVLYSLLSELRQVGFVQRLSHHDADTKRSLSLETFKATLAGMLYRDKYAIPERASRYLEKSSNKDIWIRNKIGSERYSEISTPNDLTCYQWRDNGVWKESIAFETARDLGSPNFEYYGFERDRGMFERYERKYSRTAGLSKSKLMIRGQKSR